MSAKCIVTHAAQVLQRARTGGDTPTGTNAGGEEGVLLGGPSGGQVGKQVAEVVETKRTATGKNVTTKGAETEALVTMTMVGLFGFIAVSTGHEHWCKTPEQLLPMTAPLIRMVNELPKKTRENLEKHINPLLFAAGCCAVVGPDIALEFGIRREQNERKQTARTGALKQVIRPGVIQSVQGNGNDNAIPAPPEDARVSPI